VGWNWVGDSREVSSRASIFPDGNSSKMVGEAGPNGILWKARPGDDGEKRLGFSDACRLCCIAVPTDRLA